MVSLRRVLVASVGLLLASPLFIFALPAGQDDSHPPTAYDLELKACGTKADEVDYEPRTDKGDHPTPEPSADKALVYVLRPTMMGHRFQSKLAVDGGWKGVNRGNNYFYFALQPGAHYFCSSTDNYSVLQLEVEAGKTYYLQQHVRMGKKELNCKLTALTEEEGKAKLAHAHLSVWEVKN